MHRSLLPVFALAACAAAPPSAAPAPPARPPDAEAAIARVLDDFHAAAAAADEARYFGHLAEESIFLGTDATERWDKAAFRAYAHPHFAKGKAWTFRAVRRGVKVHESGHVAWFDEDLATQNLGPARGSGALVWSGGRWQITQYNLALTIPNERFALVKEAAGPARVRDVAEKEPLAELAWLSGGWVGQRPDGELVEEHWTSADGGTLIGSGRSVKAGKTEFFEHLRIEARDGKIVYVAQPLGKPPTEFRRMSSPPGEALFANPEHDWPKQIAYRRSEEGLSVRVSGGPGERVEAWTMSPAIVARVSPE
jgi:hypothetical protein